MMELLPECDLFREIGSYQREDFEAFWAEADPLSDQEQDLFGSPPVREATTEDMDFNFGLFGDDPMLSAALPEEASPDLNKNDAPFLSEPDVIYYSESEDENRPAEVDPWNDHSYGQKRPASSVKEEPLEPPAKRPRPTKQNRSRRRQKRGPARADSNGEVKNVIFSNGKPKLYAERPFKNPKLERARLNAINAKKNRDKKKNEAARLQTELTALREQNAAIKRSLERFELRAAKAEREFAAIKELLESANLGDLLKLASGPEE